MNSLDSQQLSRGSQEEIEQGQLQAKLEMVPRLLQRGFNIEKLAELLELDNETLQRAV